MSFHKALSSIAGGILLAQSAVAESSSPEPAPAPTPAPWAQTVIEPGNLVFLNLPFIKQTKPGICTAAAAINVIRYLRPENKITANELFATMTNRSGGAGYDELSDGLTALGFQCRYVSTKGYPLPEVIKTVKANLDGGHPVLAADTQHMVVIDGYREGPHPVFFVWNQWGNGKIINGMPKGHYELQQSDLAIEFRWLVLVHDDRPVKSSISSRQICHTTREIKLEATRELVPGGYIYPAGTEVRILRMGEKKACVLVGPTNEECMAPLDAIKETGGVSGPAVVTRSIQPPTAIAITYPDGPQGCLLRGIATGDENLPGNPAIEQGFLQLTNLERTQRGLRPLKWDDNLARAARYHAASMYVNGYEDRDTHVTINRSGNRGGYTEEPWTSRLQRFAQNGRGENIFVGGGTSEQIVKQWMRTASSRASILNPRFTSIGIGVCMGAQRLGPATAVQDFGE